MSKNGKSVGASDPETSFASLGGGPAELPPEEAVPPFIAGPPEPGTPFELPPDLPPGSPGPVAAALAGPDSETVLVQALVSMPLRSAGAKLWPVRANGRPFRQPAALAREQAAQGLVRIVEEAER